MGEILNRIQAAPDKGRLLERVTAALFEDLGFVVRPQQAGSQFGFDILATRPSAMGRRLEVWKIECKNLSGPVGVDDVAPKLVWHLGKSTLDRFVLVSASEMTNELEHLLADHPFSMTVEVMAGETLEGIIAWSPRACDLLGVRRLEQAVRPSRLLFPSRASCFLDVVHQLDPPHAFDYVLDSGRVRKLYSDFEFRLMLTIGNRAASDALDLRSLEVRTLRYDRPGGRVLRLLKPKGIFEPIKWKLRPSPVTQGRIELLQSRVLRVPPRTMEQVEVLLDEKTEPGHYDLVFAANAVSVEGSAEILSAVLPLHVESEAEDRLTLNVVGRQYDSPANDILSLAERAWQRLKKAVRERNRMLFLGPTHAQVQGIAKLDSNWVIRAIGVRRISKTEVEIDNQSAGTIVLDLERPIDQELYLLTTALDRLSGSSEWVDLHSDQLRRRF